MEGRSSSTRMDQHLADIDVAQAEVRSWTTRHREWTEDTSGGQLGQHNSDDTSTRTKITHIEGLGYGIIGSVVSLTYGTWFHQSSAFLIMEFSFHTKRRLFRYKNAQISISFGPRTASADGTSTAATPVVCSLYPKSNRTPKRQTGSFEENSSSHLHSVWNPTQSIEQSMWPIEQFWVRGRKWSNRHRQEPHEVVWNVTETEGSNAGIQEPVRLGVIISCSEPFQAVVDVRATIGLGLPVRSFPWSKDDPLLFDGTTPKGTPPPTLDFNTISEQDLLSYLSDPNLSMDIRQTPSPAPGHQNAPSNPPIAPKNVDSMPEKVYRVRGLPFSWNEPVFMGILTTFMKIRQDSVRVHSFAENPYREENMAIVSFEESHDGILIPNKKMEWLLQVRLSKKVTSEHGHEEAINLLFDTHFHGFSELGIPAAKRVPYTAE